MEAPRIILNAKVYPQVTGAKNLRAIADTCQLVGEETGMVIGLAPPQIELSLLASVELPNVQIFAQHTDALEPGAGTGWVTAEAVKATGAVGSLVNHAEHKIDHKIVAATVSRLESLGLQSLVCTDSMDETRALAPLNPTFIAVEPPALIGGDISVTSADPAIVSDAANVIRELAPDCLPLCGAGVKNGKDVSAALELGAYGVLLASGVIKASDPAAALRELASGL